MKLSFDNYFIRSWSMDDVDSLAKYANNRNVWINLRDAFPHPYSREDARHWIQYALAQNPETLFAIATETEAIGGIGLHPQPDVHRLTVELGYWRAEPFWGRGIMTRAVVAITDWVFAHLNIVRIYATAYDRNPASARVLEKAGYTFEGRLRQSVIKDGKILDQLLYAVVKDEWSR